LENKTNRKAIFITGIDNEAKEKKIF